MTRIEAVRFRPVLDSRGNKTVEAEVTTESGGFGRAIAPSGASTGEYEAVERPVDEAIAAAREHVAPRLKGREFAGDQRGVDSALRSADGTEDFSEIGANSAVAVSMATSKAAGTSSVCRCTSIWVARSAAGTSRFRWGTSSVAAHTPPTRPPSRSSSRPRRRAERPTGRLRERRRPRARRRTARRARCPRGERGRGRVGALGRRRHRLRGRLRGRQ